MRKLVISLMLAAGGAIGLAGTTAADASDRIFVGVGDVTFSYGRPYYRYDNEPLYVMYERGYPRYYRYAPVRHYAPPPRYVYAPTYYGYRDRYDRYDNYDRHDRRWDRHHDRRDDRRDRRRDRRDWD